MAISPIKLIPNIPKIDVFSLMNSISHSGHFLIIYTDPNGCKN